jgi:pimeloyl-ACP methyl ester carboxylesterase
LSANARTVVFVHGLWMTGHESILMRRELKRLLDAEALVFSYRSVADDVAANADALAQFLRPLGSDEVHLVGHSLGGLVILKFLENELAQPSAPALPPGRVVLMGSPLQGIAVARSLSRFPLLKAALGRGIVGEADLSKVRRWRGARDVGVIAGSVSLGFGRLFADLPEPNDGTVAVEETMLDGAADHIVLPVSHTGMVFSPVVAQHAADFLRNGRFSRPDPVP